MATVLVLLSLAVGVLLGREMNKRIIITKELIDEIDTEMAKEGYTMDALEIKQQWQGYDVMPLSKGENWDG